MGISTAAMSLAQQSGRQLMQGVEAGDGDAIRSLVAAYGGRVYSFLYGSLGNREDALDLTQEVLFRICQKADQYDGSYPLAPWIYRVAANLCIDHSRRRNSRVHANSIEFDEALSPSPVTRDTPEDQIIRRDLQARFLDALRELPPRQKQVVEMRLLGECRLREIAEAQGISVGTVKSTLHSAMSRLREALADLRQAQFQA